MIPTSKHKCPVKKLLIPDIYLEQAVVRAITKANLRVSHPSEITINDFNPCQPSLRLSLLAVYIPAAAKSPAAPSARSRKH